MRKLILAAPLAILGCVGTPVVSDFNGSSVKIQEAFGSGAPKSETTQEAARICAKVGKKAEYASTRNLPDYQTEHLFLCL